MQNPIMSVATWPFLNEPLYRWAIFFVAVGAMGVAFRALQREMRG